MTPAALFARAAGELNRWLRDDALPLWAHAGVDVDQGGFFEQLDARGKPVEEPRRSRVVARQIYVFSTACARGWMPAADGLVEHGLRFLFDRLRRPEGWYASAVHADGTLADERFDLYEQAFVLFALAHAHAVRPAEGLSRVAMQLLLLLRRHWAHPLAGFHESAPPTVPLKANPHMHLLEAALAWEDAAPSADLPTWRALADELAMLALERLIDPGRGMLREYFDGAWRPMSGAVGRIVEPGHQFEWGWLLMRWGARRGRVDALAAAQRLVHIGERHGVDARGVAIDQLDDALEPLETGARLWPQTERIKAWHALATLAPDDAARSFAFETAAAAIDGLRLFFVPEPAGSWCERLDAEGRRLPGPARASSLYHIVCAIDALH